MRTGVATIALVLGLLAIVAGSVGAGTGRDIYERLHFVSLLTSVGGPLIGFAIVVDIGWSFAAALIIIIVVLLACSGSALVIAAGRVAAVRDGLIDAKMPD